MKILAWNCRGLGSSSTISQLQESIRLNLPDLLFLSETKKATCFVGKICRKLRFDDKWGLSEPNGRKGGLLAAWTDKVEVLQMQYNVFCMELEVKVVGEESSTESRERQQQWQFLQSRRSSWGSKWVLGGDFNDIKNKEEKQGGNERLESSFQDFRDFIDVMEMGDIRFKGLIYTWANNRVGEGFIQERLDRFFGSRGVDAST